MAARKQAIGVIGLGIIGSRVAAAVRRAGYEAWVWNRSPKPEPNFLASPAEVAETADIILLFVPDGPALIETMKALEPALAARHIVVNHATVSPAEVKEAAKIAAGKSAGFLDAPFTGSREAAEAGSMVYFVGGPKELLDRVRPVLSASSSDILEIGEIGQASLLKLATNVVAAATVEAFAEALALVNRGGVPSAKFVEALARHGVRSNLASMKVPAMITGDFEPRFALKHMFKDMQLALDAGRETGVELPVAAASAAALMSGIEKGWGDLDFAAIANHYGYPGRELLDEGVVEKLSANGTPQAKTPAKKGFFGR
jgi:3-hydroxyisobutyrate dehydrogenase and related beta-hydroxyacid dehydrogenases